MENDIGKKQYDFSGNQEGPKEGISIQDGNHRKQLTLTGIVIGTPIICKDIDANGPSLHSQECIFLFSSTCQGMNHLNLVVLKNKYPW